MSGEKWKVLLRNERKLDIQAINTKCVDASVQLAVRDVFLRDITALELGRGFRTYLRRWGTLSRSNFQPIKKKLPGTFRIIRRDTLQWFLISLLKKKNRKNEYSSVSIYNFDRVNDTQTKFERYRTDPVLYAIMFGKNSETAMDIKKRFAQY